MLNRLFKNLQKVFKKVEPLNYIFINNSILLTTETIEKNGYFIVWSQQNGQEKQILTYNEKKQNFKAFDKFIYMDDKASYLLCTDMYWDDYDAQKHNGEHICNDYFGSIKGKDLWTPVEFKNMTLEQMKYLLNTGT